jgi:hypothetical protein
MNRLGKNNNAAPATNVGPVTVEIAALGVRFD